MIVLVPLSRIRACYETGSGRPYSDFERLVLTAINEGAGSISDLEGCFAIHPRLLIETVVTLVQAGWVAVTGASGRSFVLSDQGRHGLESAGGKPKSLRVRPDERHLFVERIAGQLIPTQDVKYVTNKELVGDNTSTKMKARVSDNLTDIAAIQSMIPRRPGEWLRWVGPVELTGRDYHWLPVDVDTSNGVLNNLPHSWEGYLREPLLAFAEERLGKQGDIATAPPAWMRGGRPASRRAHLVPFKLNISEQDLICGTSGHEKQLENAIRSAKNSVFIASAFLSTTRMAKLLPRIAAATRHGVTVHLLWGYAAERDAVNLLASEHAKLKQEGLGSRLVFNRKPSRSHAKLLIWDDDQGHHACIGSCNWLSFSTDRGGGVSELSIAVRQSGGVARICRCAAALWETTGEPMSSVPTYWQRTAAQLEQSEVETLSAAESNCSAQLIFDQHHDFELRRWMKEATSRLIVLSHKLGEIANIRVVAAEARARNAGFEYAACYSESELDNEKISSIASSIESSGGRLLKSGGLHTKAVISDDNVCISSYNFLSADPFRVADNGKEIGIVLSGPVADWVYRRAKDSGAF